MMVSFILRPPPAVQSLRFFVQFAGFVISDLDLIRAGGAGIRHEPALFPGGQPLEELRVVNQAMQHGPRHAVLRPAVAAYIETHQHEVDEDGQGPRRSRLS